jgi:hypothetical protein
MENLNFLIWEFLIAILLCFSYSFFFFTIIIPTQLIFQFTPQFSFYKTLYYLIKFEAFIEL